MHSFGAYRCRKCSGYSMPSLRVLDWCIEENEKVLDEKKNYLSSASIQSITDVNKTRKKQKEQRNVISEAHKKKKIILSSLMKLNCLCKSVGVFETTTAIYIGCHLSGQVYCVIFCSIWNTVFVTQIHCWVKSLGGWRLHCYIVDIYFIFFASFWCVFDVPLLLCFESYSFTWHNINPFLFGFRCNRNRSTVIYRFFPSFVFFQFSAHCIIIGIRCVSSH